MSDRKKQTEIHEVRLFPVRVYSGGKMKNRREGRQQTLMSKKFITMLLGGTLTMMIISMLLMSDQIIAGFMLGSEAVAGITLVTPLYSLSAFFGSVISKGVPVMYSTEMGRFNKEKADHIFGLGVLMSIIAGIVLFCAISLFGEAYLHSGAVQDEILNQALGYLFWMRFTILIMPIQMLIGAAVYYDGDETISNIASMVQGIGNIVFSIVFSRFMGIRGIGLASFLFYSISLVIFLLHFRTKKNSLRMNLFFSFDLLKDVIRYSIIDSSSYLFLAAFTAILNNYVTTRYGSAYIIIVSAVTLSREFQLLFEGIGEAVGPIFSVYVGEHSHEGLRTIYRLAYKTAIIEGILVTIVLFFLASFAPQVLDVTDPALERWIVEGVRMTALGSAFVSILYLLTSYYLVIEQILLGLIACAFRDVIFSISLVFVMGGIWGIFGMFMGLVAAPAVAYAVLLIGIRMYYGREDCPLLLSKIPGGENSYLFHLRTEPEDIIRAQKQIEDLLTEHRTDRKTVQRVALLIEEMYLLIRKMNGDKAVLSECTVILKPEGVQIISKDEGVAFDMGSEDVSTVSMSAYIIAAYLEKRDFDHRHLMTMSYNRCSFFIPYAAETV